MSNNYIVTRNLAYEINTIKHVFYLGPSGPPEGNHSKKVTLGRIFSSFVSKKNCQYKNLQFLQFNLTYNKMVVIVKHFVLCTKDKEILLPTCNVLNELKTILVSLIF